MTLKEYAERLSFCLLGWELQQAAQWKSPIAEGEATKLALANHTERLAKIKTLSEVDFEPSF